MTAYIKGGLHPFTSQRIDDLFNGSAHIADYGKLFANTQVYKTRLVAKKLPCDNLHMSNRPFSDIAERLRWHRSTVEGLGQAEYALRIGVKRTALKNWETGDYRLSLDGALALRRTFGLSLDFMYEGIDDALPMTLRQAWRDKP